MLKNFRRTTQPTKIFYMEVFLQFFYLRRRWQKGLRSSEQPLRSILVKSVDVKTEKGKQQDCDRLSSMWTTLYCCTYIHLCKRLNISCHKYFAILNIRCKKHFVILNFIVYRNYENISTTKISRFMVFVEVLAQMVIVES